MPYPGAIAVTVSPYCRAEAVRGSSMRNRPEPSQRPSWAVIGPLAAPSNNGRFAYFDRTMTITAASGTGLPDGSSTRPVTVIRAAGSSAARGTDCRTAIGSSARAMAGRTGPARPGR